jgi:hypothetical protein
VNQPRTGAPGVAPVHGRVLSLRRPCGARREDVSVPPRLPVTDLEAARAFYWGLLDCGIGRELKSFKDPERLFTR